MPHMTSRGVCARVTQRGASEATWEEGTHGTGKPEGSAPQPASQEGTAGAERMLRPEWAVCPLWSGCLGMLQTSGLPSFISNI